MNIEDYNEYKFYAPERSQWTCQLFGAQVNEGISWRPLKGGEPNWFWRLTQFLVFGNRWVKDKAMTKEI